MFDFLAHCFTIWAGLFFEPNQPLLRSWYFVRTSRMLTMFMSISYWRPWRCNGICNPAFEQSLGMPCLSLLYLKQKFPHQDPSFHIMYQCILTPIPGKKPNQNPWYPLEPRGNATSQVVAIHGGLDQEERHEAIRSFKEGSKVQLVVEIFSPPKKTNQNVNVSMCCLESDDDGFILFGQARWLDVVFVCFCGWKLLCNKKIYEQIGDDFFSTQHGSTLRTCWLALMWLPKVWIFQPFSMCLGCDDVTMWDFIA